MNQPRSLALFAAIGMYLAACTSAPAADGGVDASAGPDAAPDTAPADVSTGGACSPGWGGTWTGSTAVFTTTGASPTTDTSSPTCPPTVMAVITQTGCALSINVAGQTITGTASQSERGTGMPLDHYIATATAGFDFAMRFAPQDNVENPDRNRLQYTQTSTDGSSISCYYAVTRN